MHGFLESFVIYNTYPCKNFALSKSSRKEAIDESLKMWVIDDKPFIYPPKIAANCCSFESNG
jgi:hypothetical protein